MEHWLLSCNSIQYLVADIRPIILNLLARLNAIKFFISPQFIDDNDINMVAKFDVIWCNLDHNSNLIRAIFYGGFDGHCIHRGGSESSIGANRMTTFNNGIYLSEIEYTDYSKLDIHGGIPVAKKELIPDILMHINLYCAAEIHKIDVPIEHICIDVYTNIITVMIIMIIFYH